VTLTSTLRTTPQLVGAGVDRIVHAYLQIPAITPAQLVARASVGLDLVGVSGGDDVYRLLEG
jgi:hypothetical protein